jgi:hypothetical protein
MLKRCVGGGGIASGSASRVVFSGVGKTAAEIRQAIEADVVVAVGARVSSGDAILDCTAILDGLEALSQVRELVLDKNKIRHVDFGALLPLVNLRELRVEENGLKSLSNLVPLPRLQALHFGATRITDKLYLLY